MRVSVLREKLVEAVRHVAESGVVGVQGSCYTLEQAALHVINGWDWRMDHLLDTYASLFTPHSANGVEPNNMFWGQAWGLPYNEESDLVACLDTGAFQEKLDYGKVAECRSLALLFFAAMLETGEFDSSLQSL